MVRIRLRLRRRQGAVYPVVLVLTLCLLGGMLPGGTAVRAGPSPMRESTPQALDRRSFYLTDANYDPDQATEVCADGYHMASLWEVLDVSNLAYAYDHPDAHTKDDSGSGPPSHWYGWIRTGWASSGAGTAGVGNCRNWTNTDSDDDGSIARLTYEWTASDTAVGPWEAATFGCGGTAPVWCAEDTDRITQSFLPVIQKR